MYCIVGLKNLYDNFYNHLIRAFTINFVIDSLPRDVLVVVSRLSAFSHMINSL